MKSKNEKARGNSTDVDFPSEDPDFDLLENDPELATLVASLETREPGCSAASAFRDSLRSDLLETFTEHFSAHSLDK